ncbi:hypothetical protein F5884DRAFT_84036 [Xylogone sp. PMI_703]|nr:hypothetical protein F5884DRAFT_84036 [Xylogone sp. PMI_703]
MANPPENQDSTSSTSVHETTHEASSMPEAPYLVRTWSDEDATYMVAPMDAWMLLPKSEERREYSPVDCTVCEDFAGGRPTEAIWRQRSISELDAGAEQGCKYCRLLSKGIRACVPEVELTDELALQDRLAKVFPRAQGSGPPNRYGISMFRTGDDDVWKDKVVPIRSTFSGDTSSIGAISRAREWLQNCVEKHDKCSGGEQHPAPSRLIDTKPDESQDVRLVELENLACWGKTKSIKTTKETLQERKNRIP